MAKIVRLSVFLAALTAWAGLWLAHGGSGPAFDSAPFAASGRLIAQQALALLKPPGQIIVIRRDTATFKNPAAEAQLDAFRAALLQARASIQLERVLPIDSLKPVSVPSAEFCDLIKKSAADTVIVSLMGPPNLTDADLARLGDAKRAVIAFCPGPAPKATDLQQLFEEGLLEKAIITRSVWPKTEPAKFCAVIDARNLAELANEKGEARP